GSDGGLQVGVSHGIEGDRTAMRPTLFAAYEEVMKAAPTHARGSVNRNVAPRPGSLLASTLPPWASTIPLTIASPRPAPPVARARDGSTRQKRSKTWGRCSGAIPPPESLTVTATLCPSTSAAT